MLSEEDKILIKQCYLEKGWTTPSLLAEFPNTQWCRTTVFRLIKKIKDTGSIHRKKGSGRPCTALTDNNMEFIDDAICSQETPGTHKSQRKIADELSIGLTSVNRGLRKLGRKKFKRIPVSRKDTNVRSKRKVRCRKLLDRFSKESIKKIIFTDEKDFSLEIPINRQNDVVYGGSRKRNISPERLYHETSRFSKKIMVSAGVCFNGKTKIHFLNMKEKVNTETYVALLKNFLIPDFEDLFPNKDYVFMQDGASSHTSRVTQEFLDQNVPEFIKKDEWPPQSADCNPMDYGIWEILKQKIYSGRKEKFTEPELRTEILKAWEEMDQQTIQKCISKWKNRLRMVIDQDGGPIEHLL